MTVQIPDSLDIEGVPSWLQEDMVIGPHPRIIKLDNEAACASYPGAFSTACHLDFLASWAIKDARLYLIDVIGIYNLIGEELLLAVTTQGMETVFCKSCGASLDGPHSHEPASCPACGSTLRIFQKHLSGTLTMRGGLRGVAYRISKTKWFTKFMAEPSFTRRLEIWSHRLKVEDKKSGKYLEVVTSPATGEILHKCEEPLSQHRGHGSAKQKVGAGNDG